MKDCVIICCFNSGTSLIGGVVIFSVLGYMAHESGLEIKDVAEAGPGLAFVVYPTAVSLMPFAGNLLSSLLLFKISHFKKNMRKESIKMSPPVSCYI